MKKLVITRFLGMLACLLGAIVPLMILILLKPPADDFRIECYAYLSFAIGMFPLFLLYFFQAKKYCDVSIKKLLAVFFIWTFIVFVLSGGSLGSKLTFLSGGHCCFASFIGISNIIENHFILFIAGFIVEMAILITGIFFGRINKGKSDGKYVIFLSKFCGAIIGYTIMFLVSRIFVIAGSSKVLIEYFSKEGSRLGWIIAMLPVALWYIYAGYKSFRANLKITLPIFLLWNVVAVFFSIAFGLSDIINLCGGYGAFSNGMIAALGEKYNYLAFIIAYLLEALFITGGVLLGRYFDRKKHSSKEIQEVVTAE